MGSLRQKRIAIGILLSSLGLTSLFLAQGTTRLLAAGLLDLDPSAAVAQKPSDPPTLGGTARERKDPTAILQRNIFDHEAGDLTEVSQPEPDAGTEEPEVEYDPDAPPPECEGSMRLVSTVVSTQRPEWSFAAMIGTAGKAMLYRSGMSVDGRELAAIRLHRVLLVPSDGRVCQVTMFAPEGEGGNQKRNRRVRIQRDDDDKKKSKRGGDDEGAISSSELESGIERVSETEYNVERGLVQKLLANQAELMRTARIIPHEEQGRTVGVKLYGIRRNSLLGKLGMHNGDMLRTINGFDMTSPDSALEAYSKLRNVDHLTVAVERRGKAMNIDYNIR